MKDSRKGLRQYRPGTFDKYVAYGQRERKLLLVARGIIKGFKVVCRSEEDARNLAYSLRLRARRLESDPRARFGLKVKVDGRRIYVVATRSLDHGSQEAAKHKLPDMQ